MVLCVEGRRLCRLKTNLRCHCCVCFKNTRVVMIQFLCHVRVKPLLLWNLNTMKTLPCSFGCIHHFSVHASLFGKPGHAIHVLCPIQLSFCPCNVRSVLLKSFNLFVGSIVLYLSKIFSCRCNLLPNLLFVQFFGSLDIDVECNYSLDDLLRWFHFSSC